MCLVVRTSLELLPVIKPTALLLLSSASPSRRLAFSLERFVDVVIGVSGIGGKLPGGAANGVFRGRAWVVVYCYPESAQDEPTVKHSEP